MKRERRKKSNFIRNTYQKVCLGHIRRAYMTKYDADEIIQRIHQFLRKQKRLLTQHFNIELEILKKFIHLELM